MLLALLAQLDRASGYEPEGREFESLRARFLFGLMSMQIDQSFLDHLMVAALCEARAAQAAGEVPVGAVIAHNGNIIARAHNRVENDLDCSAHAEILAIRQAALTLSDWRLKDCIICITLEPCSMCIGAIRLARIPFIVFGATDSNIGAVGSLYDLSQDERLGPIPHVISGIMADECGRLISNFFQNRREGCCDNQGNSNSYWETISSFQGV